MAGRGGAAVPTRIALLVVAWTLTAPAAPAADLVLPPIAGELAGDFTPLKIAGAPTVHWTIKLESPAPFERVAQVTADGAGVHLRAEARLDTAGNGTWRVTEGKVDLQPWLGVPLTRGEIALAGSGTLRDGAITADLALRLQGIDLGELLRFADAERKYFVSASGRVEGTIQISWRGGAFAMGPAALTLAPGAPALVTFKPSPGLLTSYVPEAVRKRYPGLEAIEMGKTPLEAKVLRLTFAPVGDSAGRVAVLRIEGQPQDRRYVAPLELDVNISGQVESLVRKLLDQRLRVGGAK